MLKKAKQEKHGSHPTTLSRWQEQEGYRRSLAEHNFGEREIMLYDRIALERHGYTATRAELSRICRCIKTMPENARCSPGGDRTNSDTDTSTTSTASTTKSAIRRRRKLRLLCRSQDWMAVLQRATGKPAGSIFIFIFNFEVVDFAMANNLELMATYII